MTTAAPTQPPAPVTLRQAFWYWLKLGFISFGGPAGQIAMMHAELVERRRWISEERFLHALNYCMVLPGPEATQLAIYIGWLLHRTPGGIVAGVLFVLPSLAILIALSWLYMAYQDTTAVVSVLYGVKPAVVAIVAAAAWRIGTRAIRNPGLAAIAVGAFIALEFLGVPFPVVIFGAAALGAGGARLRPAWFQAPGRTASVARYGPAIIDDDTPTPPHALFTWPRLVRTLLLGIGVGAACLAALAFATGTSDTTLAQRMLGDDAAGTLPIMGWFFTKAALLTFGGAYAVLPYIFSYATDRYYWLTPGQMLDGLALGETTPGPLIMVVAFVGFVGGWTTHPLNGPLGSAVAGACVATWFTFLPSFVFILAGGPLVESTRGNLHLTAPLTAISAAVVGVIASLALTLAAHALLGRSLVPAAICLSALVALVRYKVGTITLIVTSAAAGLLARAAGL